MKTKPVLIILAGVILVAGIFFFVHHKNSDKPGKDEINQFLNGFNNRIKEGNTDSLMVYFETDKKLKILKRLVNLLEGKKSVNGKEKPTFDLSLDVDASVINIASAEFISVTIPVKFTHEPLENKQSTLILKIHKVGQHQYKIIRFDARQLLVDYVAYENYVRSKTVDEKDIFSPITLAAFKTADQIKSKYDSVVWFDHVDKKTFFYVIKGTMGRGYYWSDDYKEKEKSDFKMGLVNPDLKEIIPVEYDLIHNVGGTIDGLVEVEKGDKKGFYNLEGKLIVPVNYDQVFPLTGDDHVALLRNGDDYFYLNKDLTTTDKITDLKIAGILPKIKTYGDSYTLSDSSSKNIMEYNSRDKFTSLIVSPSYLVDLQILPKFIDFQNPLRKPAEDDEGDGDGSLTYDIKFDGTEKKENNWFESVYYSVVDSYLGGRSGLYTSKHVVMIDKKQNRLLSYSADSYFGRGEGGGELSPNCNENYLKSIDDTLFEFKTTSNLDLDLFKGFLQDGPYYHYLHIKNGKLVALPCERMFNCTKFVKLDDSYLNGCYVIDHKAVNGVTPQILQYMKNEIYASYGYRFKSARWNEVFEYRFNRDSIGTNANVDDSLTAIEKYNISWLNSKINKPKANTLASR